MMLCKCDKVKKQARAACISTMQTVNHILITVLQDTLVAAGGPMGPLHTGQTDAGSA